jgi:hypothetical protein
MKTLSLIILAILLTGCASTKRIPGAESVNIVFDRSDIPSANLLGDDIGYCGNWWNYWLMSNEHQYQNAMNMLRNKAVTRNADYVLVRQINPNGTSLIFMGNFYKSKTKNDQN